MTEQQETGEVIDLNEVRRVKADTEQGYTRIANQLLENLYQCELTGRQMRVALCVIRRTYGFHTKAAWLSPRAIAKDIGYTADLNNLRADLRALKARKIITESDGEIGPNPVISEWQKQKPKGKRVENNPGRKQPADGLKTTIARVENNPKNGLKTTPIKEKKETYLKENTKERESFRIPYGEIVGLYHEILTECPRVEKLTETRKAQIRARWKSGELPDLNTWREYFLHVKESKFLTGRTQPFPGRRRFLANLEWITKESNFVKIWEGEYHRD